MVKYCVIDFETTGMSRSDRAIEIAGVFMEESRTLGTFQSLMDPGVPVSNFISRLTGISNQMLVGAPRPSEVLSDLYERTRGFILVAHNAAFDRRFWKSELALCGIEADDDFLCTLRISRRLYPWLDDHKLGTLAGEFGVSTAGHHRALSDATITAELFREMTTHLGLIYGDKIRSPDFLQSYQSLPVPAARSIDRRRIERLRATASQPVVIEGQGGRSTRTGAARPRRSTATSPPSIDPPKSTETARMETSPPAAKAIDAAPRPSSKQGAQVPTRRATPKPRPVRDTSRSQPPPQAGDVRNASYRKPPANGETQPNSAFVAPPPRRRTENLLHGAKGDLIFAILGVLTTVAFVAIALML
jgi:DNA polymerase-3 subunit epsilon